MFRVSKSRGTRHGKIVQFGIESLLLLVHHFRVDHPFILFLARCGGNNCAGTTADPILKFDLAGNLVQSFGKGLLAFPHGFYIDRDANIYAQREQAYEQQVAPQQQYAPPPAPAPAPAAAGTDDMLSQLQKLGELRDQGILTEDEFAAQKAKVLAAG